MKTLYITDMDGTLLNSDSRVSSESAEIISELSRCGALISVATARTPATVVPLLRNTYTSIPAIVLTGAAMWDRQANRFIEMQLLPRESVVPLLEVFARHGINPFVYTVQNDSHMLVFHNGPMLKAEDGFYQERRHLDLKRFVLDHPLAYRQPMGDTVLLLGMGDTQHINALADELQRHDELSVSCYPDIFNPDVSNIEVFSAGVSKAKAVLRLAEMAGADRIVAYGDNLNDLPMFAVADESVAVANAIEQVRDAADRVIGSNNADAVARDIRSVQRIR